MKNKIFKLFAVVLCIGALMLLFAGCSGSDGMHTTENSKGEAFNDSIGEDVDLSDTVVDAEGSAAEEGRKIIENIELSVQTKNFDDLLKSINEQVKDLGGYVESSRVTGREMDSTDKRYAHMILRIPAEKSDEFSGFISENSVVVSRSVTTEDVTLTYVDIESRIAALRAEKAALEKLLENAASVDEIISVQDKLTDVIYQIESLESQLRAYDNLVDYCTVTVSIDEVERTVTVGEKGTWGEIGTNLKENFANVWDIIVSVFIFFVSAIPYFLPFILAGVVLVVIFSVRRHKKNKALKKRDESISEE